MKYYTLFLKIIFPCVIVLIVFQCIAFDIRWYKNEFIKYGVFDQLGEERVMSQTDNLFKYLKGKALLEEKYYSQKEILHLNDVRSLLNVSRLITWVLFIFCFITFIAISVKKGIRESLRIMYKSFIINIFAYSSLVIISLLFFNQIFYIFHTLIFSNNYWLLDPKKEFLVIIFPQDLFLDLFIKIIMYSFAATLVGAITLKIFAIKKSQIKI